MKIYIFYVDQVVNGEIFTQKTEPHLTRESALVRFNAFVESERKEVLATDWVIECDEEDNFEACELGSFSLSHTKAMVKEEELLDVFGTHSVSVYNGDNIVIKKNNVSDLHPKGDMLKVRLTLPDKFGGGKYEFEYPMATISLAPSKYSGNTYVATKYEANHGDPSNCIRIHIYADEDKRMYHCEASVREERIKLNRNDEENIWTIIGEEV